MKKLPEFAVVGLGGSASSQEPLQTFFSYLFSDKDAAFVVIQHISPDYKSLMPDILSRYAHLPVLEIEEGMELEANRIYICTDSKGITLHKGRFQINKVQPDARRQRLPIDTLFRSLAKDCGERAVGVVLSGMGADGSQGILAIKDAGGLVMVQSPESARFSDMPDQVLQTGRADYVLPPRDLARQLAHYLDEAFNYPEDRQSRLLQDEETLKKILHLVRQQSGLDYGHYKFATLRRRTARRMVLCKAKDIRAYYQLLSEDPEEVQALSKDFLIGVTRFFRDPKVFEALELQVLPELVRRNLKKKLIKVWTIGCSTGEEAYSLAILIKDYLEKVGKELEIKIFATDIDQTGISIASKGVYSEEIEKDLTPTRLKRYFNKEGEFYVVRPELRRMVIFSVHNIFQDPPFHQLDLISCRNMLIYMQPPLQQKVFRRIHFSLNLNGYLLLGTNETVGELENGFELVDKRWRIYRNREITRSIGTEPLTSIELTHPLTHTRSAPSASMQKILAESRLSEALVEALVEHYKLACVYIDDSYRIVHAVGDFNKYLALPDKKFSINLLKMVSHELSIALGTAVRKAIKNREKINYMGVRYTRGDTLEQVSLQVQPVDGGPGPGRATCMIIFLEGSPAQPLSPPETVKTDQSLELHHDNTKYTQRIYDLEQELTYTQENLQATIEELESSNEELQSSNEELLASNEELQSTNEELQSVNEELHTVNLEYQNKIKELAQLNDDINNLLKSINIGTLFLDQDLNIRKFTPAIEKQFNLIPSDLGRPLSHISSNLRRSGSLLAEIRRVMETFVPVEQEVQCKDNHWYLMRILPYVTREKALQGTVLTFVDIAEQKLVQQQLARQAEKLRASEEKWRSLVDHAQQLIVLMQPDLRIESINRLPASFREAGYTLESLTGQYYPALLKPGQRAHVEQVLHQVIRTGQAQQLELEKERVPGVFEASFVPHTRNGQVVGIILIAQDISERKALEADLQLGSQKIRKQNKDLEGFAYIASHDLKAPVMNLQGLLDMLEKDHLSPRNRQVAEHMQQSVNSMQQTLNQLYSVIALRKDLLLNRQEVALADMLQRVEHDIANMISRSGAHISFSFDELPVVHYPEVHLHSIFLNLLTNAIKYSKDGQTPVIRVRSLKHQGYACLDFEDNGLGMNLKRDRAKLFGLFKRFHPHIEGAGIGLHMINEIVQSYGGEIQVESEENKGTTFRIYLYKLADHA